MGPDVEDELRRMTDEDREFYALLDVVYQAVKNHADTCPCDDCHVYRDLAAPKGDA